MRKIAVVTTCSRSGYEIYGRRMAASFEEYWPRDVPLYFYTEGFNGELQSDRIIYRDLLTESPDLVAFKARHANNPAAHGKKARPTWRFRMDFRNRKFQLRRKAPQEFLWDAVRFSHKPFAIFDAATKCNKDVLIWLDADTRTFRNIPHQKLDLLVPEDNLAGYLSRPRYSECGLVAYNLRHPSIENFLADFRALYTRDLLFREKQWHDSWLFDVIRRKYEGNGQKMFDIAAGAGKADGDVFAASWPGQFMLHAKGAKKFRTEKSKPGVRPVPEPA